MRGTSVSIIEHHGHAGSVQSLSCVQLFATPWTAAWQASLSISSSRSPSKPISIESVMSSNHLVLCRPLPSIPPSIRVSSNESDLRIRWPKYWSFSFSISLTNEHPGLIAFRMDWLDLLAVQGTLKSPLQHHSSKASILWCSAFFIGDWQLETKLPGRKKAAPLTTDLEGRTERKIVTLSKRKYLKDNKKTHYLSQIAFIADSLI